MKIIQDQTNEEPVRHVCFTAQQNDRNLEISRNNNNPLLGLIEKIAEERDHYNKEVGNYQTLLKEKSIVRSVALSKIIQKQENRIEELTRDIEAKQTQQNRESRSANGSQ